MSVERGSGAVGEGENERVLFAGPRVTCGLGLGGRSSLLALQTFLDEIDASTRNSLPLLERDSLKAWGRSRVVRSSVNELNFRGDVGL